MYFEQFGLSRPPFEETTNPAFFYETPALRTALKCAMACVETGGIVLVRGPRGSGKSLFGQVLLKRLPDTTKILSFAAPPSRPVGGVLQNCKDAGLDGYAVADAEQSIADALDLIGRQSHTHGAVLIDQAENLHADDLLALNRLRKTAEEAGIKLCIVLRATDGIDRLLEDPAVAAVAEAIVEPEPLCRLDEDDAKHYIKTRLAAAGGGKPCAFTSAALQCLADMSHGWPRRINHLAKSAMIRAAQEGVSRIDEPIVRACQKEIAFMPESHSDENFADGVEAPNMDKVVSEAVDRIRDEAEAVVHRALQRLQKAGTVAREAGGSVVVAEDTVARLEEAVSRADETMSRVEDFTRQLEQVGRSSEERVSLLLTSLDTAENIHDRLQGAGGQVRDLVEESQHAAVAEQRRLRDLLEEIGRRRTEMVDSLAAMQAETQSALDNNRDAVTDALHTTAEQAASEMNRRLSTVQGEIERISATAETTLAEARIATEQASQIATDSDSNMARMQAMHTEMQKRIDAVQIQIDTYDRRFDAMAKAQEGAKRVTADAADAAAHLTASVEQARVLTEEMAATVQKATGARDSIIATIEQVGASTHDGIAEQITRFQNLAATEKEARTTAEQAIRAARAALATASESEANLARAQEAALNIESIASSTLATMQEQVKRVEASVGVVVDYGVDRARSEIAALAEEANRTTQDTAENSREATLADIRERADQTMKDMAAAAANAAQRLGAARASIDERIAVADHRSQEICTNATERIEAAGQTIHEQIQNATNDLSAEVAAHIEHIDAAGKTVTAQCDEAAKTMKDRMISQLQSLDASGKAVAAQCDEAAEGIKARVIEQIRQVEDAGQAITVQCDENAASLQTLAGEQLQRINDAGAAVAAQCDQASESMQTRTDEQLQRIEAASQAMDERLAQATDTIDHASTDAVTEVHDQVHQKLEAMAKSIEAVRTTQVEAATNAIQKAVTNARNALSATIREERDTLSTTLREEHDTVERAATELHKAVSEGRAVIVESQLNQEKIDNLLRDVWGLTTTTDSRVRSLEALLGNTQGIETRIAELVERADMQSTHLGAQTQDAAAGAATLESQQGQARKWSDQLAGQLAEARNLHNNLSDAGSAGKKLVADLSGRISQMSERVEAARHVVATIQTEEQKAEQVAASVAQVAATANALEGRLNELHQGLSNPMTIIQDARTQAEELNEICLAVKRVFRGVSQASLQAEDRLKSLEQMLGTAVRIRQNMSQWIKEATHAQERLAQTVLDAPGIERTHPVVTPGQVPANESAGAGRGISIDAADRAALQRMAGIVPASPSQPNKAGTAKPASVAQRVQPLADVIRAKQAAEKQRGGEPGKGRISSDQVREMIEAANKSALAKA